MGMGGSGQAESVPDEDYGGTMTRERAGQTSPVKTTMRAILVRFVGLL